jgi:hypothetical protein
MIVRMYTTIIGVWYICMWVLEYCKYDKELIEKLEKRFKTYDIEYEI